MARHSVALATSSEFADLSDDDLFLAAPLARAKIAWDVAVWTDQGIDWSRYDAVIIRSVWDYVAKFDEFKVWLQRLAEAQVRVFNPITAIEANSDKAYLRQLEQAGIKTLPTCWIARGAGASEVEAAIAGLDWPEVVVKPSLSAELFGRRGLKLLIVTR